MPNDKVTYNYCMGTGCHELCVLTTRSANGKVVTCEQTVDPASGEFITGICQKGIVYARYPYLEHPKRLKYPLKRVGERGEGKFERISWDQAMDEIGEKLNKIRDEHGSEAVLVNNFASSFPGAFTSLHMPLTWLFVHAFGASLFPWTPVDISIAWASIINHGSFFGYANYNSKRMTKSPYILIWGASPLGWTMASNTTRDIMEAKENGAKIVTIGVVFDSTAALSDKFVTINPATDTYLALSMANIIFRDELLDQDFLAHHTVAPFLVRNDNGQFLRESDVDSEGDPNNYLIWNTDQAAPQSVAPHGQIPEDSAPDLYAEQVINGIPCSTALVKIRDEVAEWTPEAQESLTGVPAEVVEEITHEYVETENSVLQISAGLRYKNGGPAVRAAMMVPVLAGKIGKGESLGLALGGQMGEHPVTFNDLPLIFPGGDPTKARGKFPLTLGEMFEAGFPYKALLNMMGNPVQTWPNRQLWTEKILPQLDLIVAYEVRLSDTALWADYVLPDTCTLERYEFAIMGDRLILCEPAIEPVGDVKDSADFYRELSKRVGIGEYFEKSAEEWLQVRLQSPDPAIAGVQPPLTWERLKEEKMVKLNLPDELVNSWANKDFLTDSGKIEIYSEHLAEVDQAVPKYFEPYILGPDRTKYPLQLYVGRHRVFMQSQFSEFDDLRQIAGGEPITWLHPSDAAQRGIRDGDRVEVFNDGGRFRCKAQLSEKMQPSITRVSMAYAASDWDGDPPQALMTPLGVPEVEDSLNKATHKYCRSHMVVPETLDMELHIVVAWETMWDNLCEVRKLEEV